MIPRISVKLAGSEWEAASGFFGVSNLFLFRGPHGTFNPNTSSTVRSYPNPTAPTRSPSRRWYDASNLLLQIIENDFVGKNLLPKEINWIRALMNSSFGYCDDHHDLRSNEKNVFCIDCEVRMCRHCKEAHSLHRRFQIYKYSYQDVFRHSELQKYFDCSKIQTYISNNERIVHLKPRPSITKSKSAADMSPESKSKETNLPIRPKAGGTCEECGKHLQEERNRFCSITCKISLHQVEPQNQDRNQHSQRSSSPCIKVQKSEAIDFSLNDNQNSEPESSISEAQPCGLVVVNFRKRPRKATPQRPLFVFTS
ncbi:hypothetical protein RIF29_35069 [Crotalaria pallida]|uniref:B box-type domain-containing protein n=1 Tax=Crotalaria pallida TaxID=3830 RepID=A0AAN9E9J2_CROPI